MNCLKKITTFLLIILFFTLSIDKIFADYSSISFSPSSGSIYEEETPIRINVDSGSEEFVGLDVYFSYTGDIEYVRGVGADRCDTFNVVTGTGTINVECLSTSHEAGETYSSTVATLYFKATDEGSSTFTFTQSDPTISGGFPSASTYTLSLEEGNGVDGEEDLPDTGLLDNSRNIIILGTFIFLLGVGFNYLSTRFNYLSTEVKNKRIKKGRSQLERDFKD